MELRWVDPTTGARDHSEPHADGELRLRPLWGGRNEAPGIVPALGHVT